MKIRCGSHQQNRSIVRPGLSLMATKVALTAEEFRENSQRSIDLFNTEKLSTDSTHVLKSAYCNSVHFCRCNLHGACGGKGFRRFVQRQIAVAICTERVEAKTIHPPIRKGMPKVAICTERVEAKTLPSGVIPPRPVLQSARSVWRQSGCCSARKAEPRRCNLHGACGGKAQWRSQIPGHPPCCNLHGACGGKDTCSLQLPFWFVLQSARSVWRQSRDGAKP